MKQIITKSSFDIHFFCTEVGFLFSSSYFNLISILRVQPEYRTLISSKIGICQPVLFNYWSRYHMPYLYKLYVSTTKHWILLSGFLTFTTSFSWPLKNCKSAFFLNWNPTSLFLFLVLSTYIPSASGEIFVCSFTIKSVSAASLLPTWQIGKFFVSQIYHMWPAKSFDGSSPQSTWVPRDTGGQVYGGHHSLSYFIFSMTFSSGGYFVTSVSCMVILLAA